MKYVFLLSAAATLASAATALPKETEALIGISRAAPPEIFADSVIRLVESGRIAGVDAQKTLLENAFTAARQAHEPIRLIALPGLPPDNRASFRGRASDLQLDALSLETRALRVLLTVDRAEAREKFASLTGHPNVDVQSCEDPLIPDASSYYSIAGAIAQASFSADEKKSSAHIQFLIAILAGANTTPELAGFVHSVESIELSKPDMDILASALEAKLAAMPANYRSFAVRVEDLADGLDFLAARLRGEGGSPTSLGATFRKFVVTQMKGPRCKEDLTPATAFANTMKVKYLGDLQPLTREEMKPSKRGDAFTAPSYFDADHSKELAQSLDRLRFRTEGAPFSADDRSSPGWNALFNDFLSTYRAWNPSGSDIDVLHQRLTVLRWLAELTPPGFGREAVINASIAALRSGTSDRQSPAEWLWQARSILNSAGGDESAVLAAYKSSNIAARTLLATLDNSSATWRTQSCVPRRQSCRRPAGHFYDRASRRFSTRHARLRAPLHPPIPQLDLRNHYLPSESIARLK